MALVCGTINRIHFRYRRHPGPGAEFVRMDDTLGRSLCYRAGDKRFPHAADLVSPLPQLTHCFSTAGKDLQALPGPAICPSPFGGVELPAVASLSWRTAIR